MEQINNNQEDIYKNDKQNGPLTQYEVKFIGPDADLIGNAKFVTVDDLNKLRYPGSPATDTSESNDAVAVKVAPNNTERSLTFTQGIPILQAIDQIIRMSDLAKNAMQVLYNNSFEPDQSKENSTSQTSPVEKTIKWYNCSAEIKEVSWHTGVKDWKYTITYLIQTYQTPAIDSALSVPGAKYYGPHKKYEYWYTGKNTEVLSYSQTLDNNYYTVVLGPTANNSNIQGSNSGNAPDVGQNIAGNPSTAPIIQGQVANETTQGSIGATPHAVNNYVTSLYDPSAQAEATIGILGDPDFMIQDSSYSEASLYNRFYGTDGFTVNPNGGQVFVEIDFKEAVDYVTQDTSNRTNTGGVEGKAGTLSLNDSIQFWTNDSSASTASGLCYQLITVTSNFSLGKFTQVLKGVMVPINNNPIQSSNSERPSVSQSNGTNVPGPLPGNANAGTGDNGLLQDNPKSQIDTTTIETINVTGIRIAPITSPTRTGPVADDDGSAKFNNASGSFNFNIK